MRYHCEFPRKDLKFDTDSRIAAEQWLREQDSEGAEIVDTSNGDRAKLFNSGDLLWEKHRPMVTLRHTYTFAVLQVSKACYDEIHGKLEAAGYTHAFQQSSEGAVIDMHGIALQQDMKA